MGPPRVLPIYDSKEAAAARDLEEHAAPYVRNGTLRIEGYRPAVPEGPDARVGAFDLLLNRTRCVIVITSPTLLASPYWELAAFRIEEFRRRGDQRLPLIIVPLIFKECSWRIDPLLGQLRPIPANGVAIHKQHDRARAWCRATEEIVRAIEEGGSS